jgi:hypothetical protein
MALHKKSGVTNPLPEFAHYARDLPLGPGAARTEIAGNLRASVVDVTAGKIAGHVRTRLDKTAADGNITDQLRTVSDTLYPVAGGGSMKRQQDLGKVFGK